MGNDPSSVVNTSADETKKIVNQSSGERGQKTIEDVTVAYKADSEDLFIDLAETDSDFDSDNDSDTDSDDDEEDEGEDDYLISYYILTYIPSSIRPSIKTFHLHTIFRTHGTPSHLGRRKAA